MLKVILLLLASCGSCLSARSQTGIEKNFAATINVSSQTDSVSSTDLERKQRWHAFERSLWVSVPLIASGVYGTISSRVINKYEIKEERDEHFSAYSTHIDDYLAFTPTAMVFGLNAMGIKGRHDGWNQLVLFAQSEIIMEAIVYPTKKWTHVTRPDGSNYSSFPSGHTAQAFLSAEFLRKEYGGTHPWIAAGGYAMATSVGVLRMLNDKHWLTDVLAGAGIGILSVNLAYLTHRRNWQLHKRNISLVPTYNGTTAGLYLSYGMGKK